MRKLLLLCSSLLLSFPVLNTALGQMIVYSNSLQGNWQNWGWATIDYNNTSPVFSNCTHSISVTMGGTWEGIQIVSEPSFSSTPYGSLSFWLNGGSSGGQHLQVYALANTNGTQNTGLYPAFGLPTPHSNTWAFYTVPLSSLGAANLGNFSGFVIQDEDGTSEPTFYLDNIQLNPYLPLTANAGTSVTNCEGANPVTLGGSPTASGGAGGYSYSWSPTNALSSSTLDNPVASPTSTTTYTVTVTDAEQNTAHSSVTITINTNLAATASTGGNQTVNAGSSTAGLGGVVGGSATGGVWSTSGSGAFSPNTTTLNATYTPSAADITAGLVTLTLTTTGQSSPCSAATAQMVVTIVSSSWIYTNALVNGWANSSYSATVGFANTSPIYPGCTDSASVTITSAYGGLQLLDSPVNNAAYRSIAFLLNGGPSGGQSLQMYATTGSGHTVLTNLVALTAPLSNTWQQYWVPLASLGVSNAANFSGFVIQDSAGTAEPAFYLDNIQLTSYPAPPLTPITVNVSQGLRTADARWFAINTAVGDRFLDSAGSIGLLTNMGIKALRFPGGSLSDEYDWHDNEQDGSVQDESIANFIQVVTNINATTMITVNYGTGTSNEAAAWVAYCNAATNNTTNLGTDANGINWQTAGFWASLRAAAPKGTDDGSNFLRISRSAPLGFKYWEVGNECYGSWETDDHSVEHDPYTYAQQAQGFIGLMKAVDPTIKVGVVVTPYTNGYANNENHAAVDPVTGYTNYGWTPVLLATLKSLGVTPDFAIFHNYPFYINDNDAALLVCSEPPTGWAFYAGNLRGMINDYLGTAVGTNIELVCTENNADSAAPGKQSVSLVMGLYKMDDLAALMQTEFNGLFWFCFHAGVGTGGDLSNSLYGWRDYGDFGIAAPGCYSDPWLYPQYYTTELMTNFVQAGDTVVAASSIYPLLSAYAVKRTNGNLTILVINKDPTNTLNGSIAVAGFSPGSSATTYSYGVPQDNAVDFSFGSTGVAQGAISLSGPNISYSFAPYSATVFSIPATTLAASAGGNQTICAGGSVAIGGNPTASGGSGGYSYSWSPSSGLSNSTVADPTASPAGTTTYTVTVTDSEENSAQSSVTVTVQALPTITLGASPTLVYHSSTITNLPYTATSGSPNEYSISYGLNARAAGFSNVALTVLPASPIPLTVPIAAGANVYNGTLTLNNSTTGCSSANYPFTVTVTPLPVTLTGSRLYDGTATANASILTIVTNYDGTNLTLLGSATLAGPGAGVQNISSFSGLGLGGAAAGNYTLTGASGSVTVNPLPVVLTGSRPYDGTATAAAGILTVSNAIGSDNVYPAGGSATLAGASVGPEAITSAGTLALGGTAAGNYTLTGFSGTVTVTNPFLPFTITSSSLDATGTYFVVCWQSVPGVVYNVLTNTSLNAPQPWAVIGGPITATNTNTCFTLPGGVSANTNVFVVIQQ